VLLLKNIDNPRSAELGFYEECGGYEALRKAYALTPGRIIGEVRNARLRGRGGAGFEAAVKWAMAADSPIPERVLVCNAEEGEPGTFKDRELLVHKPHMVLEGMVIAARAIGAKQGFMCLRYEYPEGRLSILKAISEAEERGYLGRNILESGQDFSIKVHVGAGAYICGEETALLESLEGRRGQPRIKPPYPAAEGYMGLPTVVNNVETLCNVPLILVLGAKAYSEIGAPGSPGPKLFPVSGHVCRPGLYELPMGITLGELIFEHAGGVRGGRKLKGVIPGGISTPVLTADKLDCRLDFVSVRAQGSSLGSGAVIVFDERTCMVKVALRTAAFFERESCGRCTPCREGTGWLRSVLERIEKGRGRAGDLELLGEVAENMSSTSFCPLGVSAGTVARSYVDNYREEFEAHVARGACGLPMAGAL
jgi:NADH-quinone oxidoreductase subunit F